jgi:hypothetical protein
MRAYLVTILADEQGPSTLDNLAPGLFFGGIGLLIVAVVVRQVNRRLKNSSSKAKLFANVCIALGLCGICLALFG